VTQKREKAKLKNKEIFFLAAKQKKPFYKKCCKKAINTDKEKQTKQNKLTKFVESKGFDFFIIGAIVLNSLVLGTDHYGQSEWETSI